MKYKYLIYKIYSWGAKERGDTPVTNTILALGFSHLMQFAVLVLVIDRILIPLPWFYNVKKVYIFFILAIYFTLFYLLVYNKQRWESYIEEFSNEADEQRRRGNIIVIAYLIGSILLFFISLPILFTLGKHINDR